MKRKLLSLLASALFVFTAFAQTPYELVNPFIGTGGHGHTYPGATTPHGAVQLSPDTRKGNWDACSGYHYSDNTLFGFSHTHLSGTGCADLGDVLIAPYYGKQMTFRHSNEVAHPGYYSVTLDDGTFCELTATTYCGMHHYKYPAGTQNIKLKLDLGWVLDGGYAKKCEADVTAPNEICGMRTTHSWINNRNIYFVIRFDRGLSTTQAHGDYNISKSGEQTVSKTLEINFYGHNELTFKVGISTTSIEQAKRNMDHDIKGFNFAEVKSQAQRTWEDQLNRITFTGGTPDQRRVFYTALYHTLVVPNIISDANAQRKEYSTFSNWDTFRAWNPLMTILDETLVGDMINSMLTQYNRLGYIPMWGLQGQDTHCMIGYHAASIIWDAYQKGIKKFDAEKALTALVETSKKYGRGISDYESLGFFSTDLTKESVSETLEIAYDDWCIAMLAYSLGYQQIYQKYASRSLNYEQLFDGKTGFFRGRKRNGNMNSAFNCYQQTKDYTEATPWQYRFFVPHDVNGMVQLFGGREACLKALDSLFTTKTKVVGGVSDISGLIGQYAHGNEPSHHMAFLYTYLGDNSKTDHYVQRILNEMYRNAPDGISGNEDCGQMSAWYIMASMGFYPMCPGSGRWVACTPIFENVMIDGVPLSGYRLPMYEYSESQWRNKVSIPYCTKDVSRLQKKETTELGCRTKGATIYYTLDGKTPTESSIRYTKSFVPKGKVLKIRAYKKGYDPSSVKTIRFK